MKQYRRGGLLGSRGELTRVFFLSRSLQEVGMLEEGGLMGFVKRAGLTD